jgi:hypothetical protein
LFPINSRRVRQSCTFNPKHGNDIILPRYQFSKMPVGITLNFIEASGSRELKHESVSRLQFTSTNSVVALVFFVSLVVVLTAAWISGILKRPIIYAAAVYIGPRVFILMGLLRSRMMLSIYHVAALLDVRSLWRFIARFRKVFHGVGPSKLLFYS